MSQRLILLYIPHPFLPKDGFTPWGEDVFKAIGDRHEIRILDKNGPVAPQLDGVDVVIDLGGEAGSREGVSEERRRLATELADASEGRVRLWQIVGTGFEHFDLDHWKSKRIPVANAPGQFSAVGLAECAMMFILMLTRKYPVARANFPQGLVGQPLGTELPGLQLGIVGFGASGKELARRALAFGMRITAVDIRDVPAEEVEEFQLEFVGKPADLDQVVSESDVLSLHLHVNEETRHLVDARCLSLMKPTALLVNIARGALVDDEALAQALLEGRIGGAGLDVFSGDTLEGHDWNSPIYSLPNVVTTPHIAGVTDGTSRKRAQAVAENVDRIASGLPPLYRIDE